MLSFDRGFLWGVSTSAHQFEGSNTHNQWAQWERQGRIRSGHAYEAACDWWCQAEADLDRCRGHLGLNALRISVHWGRIEPREGEWDQCAVARYCSLLRAVAERGMRPFVTLHHFTHPLWLETAGGFCAAGAAAKFARFAERLVAELGEFCRDWLHLQRAERVCGLRLHLRRVPAWAALPALSPRW